MKRVLVTSFVLTALVAIPAMAADLAVKAPIVRPPGCAQFGGGYVGAQVGYDYYDYRRQDLDFFASKSDFRLPRDVEVTKSGVAGGLTVGYNWQPHCTVFGIEADWSWTSLNASEVFLDGDGGIDDFLTVSSRKRGFGTLRTRSGVVVDNLLLYVTGGLVAARIDRSWSFHDRIGEFGSGIYLVDTFNSNRTRWGWTAGAGTEWAWTNAWSIKSEFLYMRFEEDNQTFTSVHINPGVSYRFKSQDSEWVTRIGINYHWGNAPVVARY